MKLIRTVLATSALTVALVSGVMAQDENLRRGPAGVVVTAAPAADPIVRDAAPAPAADRL